MKLLAIAGALALAAAAARADVLLHNPHGSNNKQSDANEDVPATNRLFHSRNANEGGYNSPLRDSMYYLTGSILPIEMTFNLGLGKQAGGHEPSHSGTLVLQYMCANNLRDGSTSTRIAESKQAEWDKAAGGGLAYLYGMHENWNYYNHCRNRPRNAGLFTASIRWGDNADSAKFTRQNPSGARFGFECPEERDYYPYWWPTPWRDIAIITDTPSRCAFYKSESQNVKERCHCKNAKFDTMQSCPNNMWMCEAPWSQLLNNVAEPECLEAPWLQENLMSNKLDGYPFQYNWTIPNEPSASCALRVRYNVTTGDWPTWHDEAQLGRPLGAGERMLDHRDSANPDESPVQMDPGHKCCEDADPALCECQLGHHDTLMPFTTYQDRSHRFSIVRRPSTVKNTIHNLNVKGKRGNIVQTFPAVEYDFVPTVLHCRVGEWIHAQWTGSDNNRNNVAGEGRRQTDRSNMIQILDAKRNYPIDPKQQSLFEPRAAQRLAFNELHEKEHLCKEWAEVVAIQNENERERDPKNCAKLNPQVPYYDGGLLPCKAPGIYYYMSSRNNNFSNRSQKGTIVIHPCAGNATCSNADTIPTHDNGKFNPGDPSNGAAQTATLATAALLAALLAALF